MNEKGRCQICGRTECVWADKTETLCDDESCVEKFLANQAAARAAEKKTTNHKETDMGNKTKKNAAPKKAAAKKATPPKKAAAPKPPKAEKAPPPPKAERKKLGEVALVMRVPRNAVDYIDGLANGRPRTVLLREILAKGDVALGKLLTN